MLVFAYGGLKKGQRYHHLLGKPTFLGIAETEPNYLLYDAGLYSCLVEVGIGKGREIEGELFKIIDPYWLRKEIKYPFKEKPIAIKGITEIVLSHFYESSVEKFLDCGTSWPRE